MKNARKYVITDGSKYIRKNIKGKFEQVSNLSLADTYTNKMARNILRNSLSRTLKSKFYIALLKDGDVIRCGSPAPLVKDIQDKEEICIDKPMKLCQNAQRWVDKFTSIDNITEIAETRAYELRHDLKIVDNTISDINHYIEWNTVSAATGYKLEARLHELLVKRRDIKDEQMIVETICDYKPDKNKDVQNILKVIKGLESRKYTPRMLNDLFATDKLA